jgi:hypothetical protein
MNIYGYSITGVSELKFSIVLHNPAFRKVDQMYRIEK